MARIPDKNAMGRTPAPKPQRGVAGYNPQAADTGAGLVRAGAEVADLGMEMKAAQERAFQRKEALNRVQGLNEFNRRAQEEYLRFKNEADLASPDTVKSFSGNLKSIKKEVLGQWGGSEESALQLQTRLDQVDNEYGARISADHAKASTTLLTNAFEDEISGLTERALENPGQVTELFGSIDGILGDMASALPPAKQAEFREYGQQQVTLSAVNALLDRQQTDEVKALLESDPAMPGILGDKNLRQINSRIAVADRAREKAMVEYDQKLGVFAAALGIDKDDLPKSVKLHAAGLPTGSGRQTLADKVSEFESVMTRVNGGKPYTATPAEVARMGGAGAGGDGGAFGGGLKGRALDIMTEGAAEFGAGLMSADDERRFISAVTEYTQSTQFPNPDTGVMEYRSPRLPAFVVEAFERRPDMKLPGAETIPVNGQPGQPQQPAVTPAAATSEAGEPEPAATQALGGKTLWDLAPVATGPVPTAAEAIGRVPVIGDMVPSGEITQARNYIPLIQRDLVKALQNNPRYAEGEREAIENEVKIAPEFFDTPTAYRNRLIAIDDALEVRQNNAFNTANSQNVGREERIQAMNVLNAIMKFRVNMGIPQRVKTREEALKLPPGTPVILPDGSFGTVPQGGGVSGSGGKEKIGGGEGNDQLAEPDTRQAKLDSVSARGEAARKVPASQRSDQQRSDIRAFIQSLGTPTPEWEKEEIAMQGR